MKGNKYQHIDMAELPGAVQNWLKENKLVMQDNEEIIRTAFDQNRADILVWLRNENKVPRMNWEEWGGGLGAN